MRKPEGWGAIAVTKYVEQDYSTWAVANNFFGGDQVETSSRNTFSCRAIFVLHTYEVHCTKNPVPTLRSTSNFFSPIKYLLSVPG